MNGWNSWWWTSHLVELFELFRLRARLSGDKHVNKIFACHFIFAHSARVKEGKNQKKSNLNINSQNLWIRNVTKNYFLLGWQKSNYIIKLEDVIEMRVNFSCSHHGSGLHRISCRGVHFPGWSLLHQKVRGLFKYSWCSKVAKDLNRTRFTDRLS